MRDAARASGGFSEQINGQINSLFI